MLRVAGRSCRPRHRPRRSCKRPGSAVVRGLDRFEGRSSVRTWVFRILSNLAKTRGVRESRTVPWSSYTPDDEGPTVDPERFRGPADRWPGHWTDDGVPRQWQPPPDASAIAGEIRTLSRGPAAAAGAAAGGGDVAGRPRPDVRTRSASASGSARPTRGFCFIEVARGCARRSRATTATRRWPGCHRERGAERAGRHGLRARGRDRDRLPGGRARPGDRRRGGVPPDVAAPALVATTTCSRCAPRSSSWAGSRSRP